MMKRTKGNKVLSLLLASALVLSMSGTTALAEVVDNDTSAVPGVQENLTFDDVAAVSAADVIQTLDVDQTSAVASLTTDDGSSYTYYETLQEAVDAAGTNSDAVVTMLTNITGEVEGEVGEKENVTIASGQDITLDLAGYTLCGTGTASVITINGSMTLEDSSDGKTGTITGGVASNGGGVDVESGSFTMKGGTITQNSASTNGGGIYVTKSTDITISNGAILENSAVNGGGIYLNNNTEVEMSGGTISENTSNDGGGVYLATGSTFSMSGGVISENVSEDNGGGLYIVGNVTYGSSATVNGGVITNNTVGNIGGGVYISRYGSFTLNSGAVYANSADAYGADIGTISSNNYNSLTLIDADKMTLLDEDKDETYNGWYNDKSGSRYEQSDTVTRVNVSEKITSTVYLIAGYAPALSYDLNAEDAVCDKLPDTIYYKADTSEGVMVTVTSAEPTLKGYIFSGWATSADAEEAEYQAGETITITADTTLYAVWQEEVVASLEYEDFYKEYSTVQKAVDAAGTNSDAVVTLLTDITEDEGEVGAKENVTIASGQDITLNLAGYTLSGTGDESVITVNGSMTLDDSSDEKTGTVTGGVANSGGGVYVNGGSFTMNGGTITGNSATSSGGGMFVQSYSTVCINGGSITDNEAVNYGGGVYVSKGVKFTMSAGAISGNELTYSSSCGGGIYVSSSEDFIISGGTISGNSATNGGGIYLNNSSIATMSGGSISGNTASSGGGVYILGSTFTMSGGVMSENTAGEGGGLNLFASSSGHGSATVNGGVITNNTATTIGGGVYVRNNCSFTFESGAIYANSANSYGADICNVSNSGLTLIDADQMTLPEEDSDKTYNGWYNDKSGERYEKSDTVTRVDVSEEITKATPIIAGYAPALSYDLNSEDAVCDTLPDTVYYKADTSEGVTVTVTSAEPTLKGYIFSGWATSADAEEAGYQAGEMITITADTTLYAVWEEEVVASLEYEDFYKEYSTVQKAVDAAGTNSDAVVTLLTDITEDEGEVGAKENVTIASGQDITLDLAGYTLSGTGDGSVITVNGTLTLNDSSDGKTGTIIGGKANNGGGVYVKGGSFTMDGGTITGNSASSSGGGVYANNGSSFALVDGYISENEATYYGAGVYISSNVSFDMSGGTISGNEAAGSSSNGGGIFVSSDKITISGGTISGNSASKGGGISLTNSGAALEMSNGKISGNSATSGGGVYLNQGNTFEMSGGVISENTSSYGGGLYINGNTSNPSSVTVDGGVITDNTATLYGGGVCVYTYCSLTLTSGALYANSANSYGADIYSFNGGILTLSDAIDMELLDKDKDNTYNGWYEDRSGVRYANSDTVTRVDVSNTINVDNNGMFLIAGYALALRYDINADNAERENLPETVYFKGDASEGAVATVASEEPIREGYVLVGWATTKDAAKAEYKAGDTLTITEDTTLYAYWVLEEVTLTYDLDGGRITDGSDWADGLTADADSTYSLTGNYGDTIELKSGDGLSKEGYHFAGWKNESGDIVSGPIVIKEDTMLTADWAAHTYDLNNTEFVWNDDYTACDAVIECTVCGEKKTYECDVTSEVTDPTCTVNGATTYTATVVIEGETLTDTKLVEIPALGHIYSEDNVKFTWSSDYTSCTADFYCGECEHVESVECDVTIVVTDPTCTEGGYTTHTAEASVASRNDQTVTAGTVAYNDYTDALGHDYEYLGWIEDEDTGIWYAHFRCRNCYDDVYEAGTEGSEVVEEPDHVNEGREVHYIYVIFEGYYYWFTLPDTTIPAYGHEYEFDRWEYDSSTGNMYAVFECVGDDDTQRIKADVTSVVVEPATCDTDGTMIYTAVAEFEGETVTTSWVEGILALGHDWVWSEKIVVDGDTTITSVYFTCTRCDAEVEEDIIIETNSEGIEVHTDLSWNDVFSANDLAELFEQFDDGEEIDIDLEIGALDEEEVPEEDVALIEEVVDQIWNNSEIFYMDISLILTVTHNDDVILDEVVTETNIPITFTVTIPGELLEAEGDSYYVIRVHEGKAEILETTDNGDGTLTFESDLFSTYAIAKGYNEEVHNYELTGWSVDGEGNVYAKFEDAESGDIEYVKADVTSVITKEPTCTEDGEIIYTATAEFKGEIYETSLPETIPADGHEYEFLGWMQDKEDLTWYAHFRCVKCGDDQYAAGTEYTFVVSDPTCVYDGEEIRIVVAYFEDEPYWFVTPIEIPAYGHSYVFEVWTVDDDGNVYAKFVCSYCDDVRYVEAEVTTEVTESTCTESGKKVYTATATLEGSTVMASWTEIIPATGHEYGFISWMQDDEDGTWYAYFSCANCGDDQYAAGTEYTFVVSDPTCVYDGEEVIIVVAYFDDEPYWFVTPIEIPAYGHSYGFEAWTFDDDGNVYAEFICNDCGDVLTVKAEVTSETTEPTCTERGKKVYTATATLEDNTVMLTWTEIIPATGHDYVLNAWTFDDDGNVYATFVCEKCGDTVIEQAEVISEITKAPTATEEGEITYTVTVTGPDGKIYETSRTEAIPATGDDNPDEQETETENPDEQGSGTENPDEQGAETENPDEQGTETENPDEQGTGTDTSIQGGTETETSGEETSGTDISGEGSQETDISGEGSQETDTSVVLLTS